jgi:4-amino-4-deoxychorismate lyase
VAVRLVAVVGQGVVSPETPIVRADDAGLVRGDGCFEGLRVVTGADGVARVAKLDRHLVRMGKSAAALGIPFDADEWTSFVTAALAQWHEPGELSLKLVLTRGRADLRPTGYLMLFDVPAFYPRLRRDGLRVITLSRGVASDAFADAPWLLGGVKTLSYAVNMAAQREAERRDADDVIFVSTDGLVLEAPTSSVVWANGRSLRTTPTGTTGILAGTTQQLLFERAAESGWDVGEATVTVDELHAVEAVWLVASVRGPVDVVSLDGVARARRPDVDREIRALAGFGQL